MIVLTGASGLVGSAILERGEESAFLALHHKRDIGSCGRMLSGDITKPLLGLPRPTYRALCADSDVVIHCAATVSMAAKEGDYASINVTGTQHVATFAEDAGATLVHLSTAFVHQYGSQPGGPETYQASKHQAEEIVRASHAKSVIVRPSIVVGDSRTGRIGSEQGFHLAIGNLLAGPIRVVPGDGTAFLDFVPQDYVADVILATGQSVDPPTQLWLTCGERALSLDEFAQRVNRFIIDEQIGGQSVRVANHDSLALMLMQYPFAELSPRQRVRLRGALQLARHL